MRNNLDLPIANLGDLNNIAKVSNAAIDFDPILEELLKGGDVEDLIGSGLRGVDDKLFLLDPSV